VQRVPGKLIDKFNELRGKIMHGLFVGFIFRPEWQNAFEDFVVGTLI
jgi:hypothetical protein